MSREDAAPLRRIAARFGANSGAILASQALNTILASLFAIVFIRHFGREEYGIFTTVFTYLSFFTIFQTLGIDTLMLRDVARDRRALDDLGAAIGLRVALSLASMVASWCLVPIIHPSPRLVRLVVLASLSSPLSVYSLFIVSYITELRMGYPKLAFGVWSLLYTGARVAMVVSGFSLEAFVVFSLFSDGMMLLIAWSLGRRDRVRPRIRFDPSIAKRLLLEAWPIAAGALSLQALLRIDQIMLYRMRGADAVSLYAVPVRFVEFANIIPYVFTSSAFPMFARLSASSDGDRLGAATSLSLRLMAWAAAPFGAFLFAYPETCLGVVFGDQFRDASVTMRILAYSPLFAFANSILFNRLLATGAQKTSAALATGAAALNASLNVPLITFYGGEGAALATMIAYGSVPLAAAFVPGIQEIGRSALWCFVRPVASSIAAGALVLGLGLGAVSGAILLSAFYVIGLVVSGEWGISELRLVMAVVGRKSTRKGGGRGPFAGDSLPIEPAAGDLR